jgi:hypothetical protein
MFKFKLITNPDYNLSCLYLISIHLSSARQLNPIDTSTTITLTLLLINTAAAFADFLFQLNISKSNSSTHYSSSLLSNIDMSSCLRNPTGWAPSWFFWAFLARLLRILSWSCLKIFRSGICFCHVLQPF